MNIEQLDSALVGAGFIVDTLLLDTRTDAAGMAGMSDHGAYRVHRAWSHGKTTVVLEQNDSPVSVGRGLTALMQHPPVLVIETPTARVACDPEDIPLVLNVIEDLSG